MSNDTQSTIPAGAFNEKLSTFKFAIKQREIIDNGQVLFLVAAALNYICFFNGVRGQTSSFDWSDPSNIWVALTWYIGADIGSTQAGFNISAWSIRTTNRVNAYMLLTAGIVLYAHQDVWPNVHILLYIGRFLAGLSYGFLIVATSAQIGDNVWKTVREFVGGIPAFIMNCALFIAVSFLFPSKTKKNSMISDFLVTPSFVYYVAIVGSIYVLIKSHHSHYEPLSNFIRNNDQEKIQNICNTLYDDAIDSTEIQEEIQQKTQMIAEDSKIPLLFFHVFRDGNWKPICLMILLRLLCLSTSNVYFIFFTGHLMINGNFETLSYPYQFFYESAFRMFISMASLCLMQFFSKIDRKWILLLSGLGSGISFSVLIAATGTLIDFQSNTVLIIAKLFVYFFAIIGLERFQHIYAIEAFPTTKRNASIAFIIRWECTAHGCIIALWFLLEDTGLRWFFWTTPFILIFGTIVLFVKLPDTRGKTLRECRSAFNESLGRSEIPKFTPLDATV